MSSGTSSGDEKNDAGKLAWASTENKWGKASATVNKVTATASVDIGVSVKVNASAQFSINAMTWSLTGLSMQSVGLVLTCIGSKNEAKASEAKVNGIINGLTTLKNDAEALSSATMNLRTKNALLLNCISALNLNS